MTHRILGALLLSGALVIPVLAQQDNGNTQTPANQPAATQPAQTQAQPATQEPATSQPAANPPASTQTQVYGGEQSSTSQSSNSSSVGASGKEPLAPPPHEGFWGHLNPFARKSYVQRQTTPIKDRVNELDELTAANSKSIKDADARAQQGIQMASNKADQASIHATEAGNKAQAAQQSADQANNRLNDVEKVVTNIDQYKPSAQTELCFRPGQTELSKAAKDALDEMATPLKDQRGYIIEVQGFAAGHGQAAISESQKMAESVVRYLVLNHEVPVYRIYLVGMGNAPVQQASATGETAKPKRMTGGRVEISLLKNNLEQLSSNKAGNPAATTPQ
jgi:outer membrane protein OmpA-like peptidoglycan-associated protein